MRMRYTSVLMIIVLNIRKWYTTVTEVRAKKVLGILKDDRIAILKKFLTKIP